MNDIYRKALLNIERNIEMLKRDLEKVKDREEASISLSDQQIDRISDKIEYWKNRKKRIIRQEAIYGDGKGRKVDYGDKKTYGDK
ncbi:MAG: hypothetical protein K9L21_03720 [Spirochaetia bacterium]|nr:hypothetical protein [Spirochaetia bacterium]